MNKSSKLVECPNCNSNLYEVIGPISLTHPAYHKDSNLVQCTKCDLFYISPLPDEIKLAKIYHSNYHNRTNQLLNLIIWKIYGFELSNEVGLIQKFKRTGNIIDIGAGSGELLRRFPKKSWKRSIYDPFLSKKDILNLTKILGDNINNYASLNQYPKESFDVVIIRNVIEHTTEFKKLITDIRRILKKDGICFIRTPNMDSLDFKLFKNSWYAVNILEHVSFFNRSTLKKVMKDQDFRIILSEHTRGSVPLSLFRSTNFSMPKILKLGLSLGYFLTSSLFGEGIDQRLIVKK